MSLPLRSIIFGALVFFILSCNKESSTTLIGLGPSYPQVVSIFKHAWGFNRPAGLAFDSTGNLLVVNLISGVVNRVSLNGSVDTFAVGIPGASGIAVSPSGSVYVSYYSDGTVKRVPPTGGTMVTFASNQNNPAGLAYLMHLVIYTLPMQTVTQLELLLH